MGPVFFLVLPLVRVVQSGAAGGSARGTCDLSGVLWLLSCSEASVAKWLPLG
jgi:hypothetical protein